MGISQSFSGSNFLPSQPCSVLTVISMRGRLDRRRLSELRTSCHLVRLWRGAGHPRGCRQGPWQALSPGVGRWLVASHTRPSWSHQPASHLAGSRRVPGHSLRGAGTRPRPGPPSVPDPASCPEREGKWVSSLCCEPVLGARGESPVEMGPSPAGGAQWVSGDL